MMILPILTYGNTIKTVFTDSQLVQLESFENRAKTVIGIPPIRSMKETVESQICSMVERCLKKEIGHESFDNYCQMINHLKETKNNNMLIKLPKIKLEVAKQSFYFSGAKLFNGLPLTTQTSLKLN